MDQVLGSTPNRLDGNATAVTASRYGYRVFFLIAWWVTLRIRGDRIEASVPPSICSLRKGRDSRTQFPEFCRNPYPPDPLFLMDNKTLGTRDLVA